MTSFPRARRVLAPLLAALLAGGSAFAAAAPGNDDPPVPLHKPKQALDDRADPGMRTDDVGKGSHFARKPTQPGTYFSDRNRDAVHRYYASHPGAAGHASWEIGKPLPAGEALAAVPQPIAVALPRIPPGHRYVAVDGDILLIATGSRMVVDGISAAAR